MRTATHGHWRLALFALLGLFLALLAVPARMQGADAAPFTATVYRQADNNGPYSAATTIYDSDYSATVELAWAKPAEAGSLVIRWLGPDGKVYYESPAEIEAGAKFFSAGLRVNGYALAKMKGLHTIAILRKGETQAVAQATFTVAPAPRDPNKPRFTGALSTNVDDDLVPQGKATTFFSDAGTLWVTYTAKAVPAKGHKLVTRIFNGNDELVLTGSPSDTDGKSDMFGEGFYLAGRAWAQDGGKFVARVYWDQDPDPVVSLPFSVKTANRWALLIGIADYPGDKNDLPGCDVDVDTMNNLLVGSFGFPKNHITKLLSLDATKKNIVQGIKDLAAKAKKDDAIVIYYSGHGGQVPDLDGDEEDGWDETIVPAEPQPEIASTEADIARQLTDDEIAKLLSAFVTDNVTVIFDSCHSGSAVRAAGPEAPGKLRRPRKFNQQFSRELEERANAARQNVREDSDPQGLDIGKRYVFLAAARPWELASGNPEGGFFTNALVPALAYAEGKSWDELLTDVREDVLGTNFSQNPAAEGAVRRLPFSLAESTTDAPYVRPNLAVAGAIPAKSDEEVPTRKDTGTANKDLALVQGEGTVYLEQIGALYDVYPAGDATMTGKAKGRVQITGDRADVEVKNKRGEKIYDDTHSTAVILSGAVARGDRLVAVSVPFPAAAPKVGLYLEDGIANDVKSAAQAIDKALRADNRVRVMDKGAFSEMDYIVQPTKTDKGLAVTIWSPGGWFLADFAGTERELADKVDAFIAKRHAAFTRFVRVDNPSPTFRLRAELVGGDAVRKPGATVTIRVQAGAAAYATALLSAGFDAPQVVATTDAATAANGTTTLAVKLPAGATGRIPIKVIVTEKALNTTAIAGSAPADRVDALFRALQANLGAGGGNAMSLSTAGWAATTVWVDVQ